MNIGDETAFRDYQSWIRMMEYRAKVRKFMLRLFLAAFLFVSGMFTQYIIEARSTETAALAKEIRQIESMPEPTAAQKAASKRNARRVSTEYLQKRKAAK